MKKSKLSELIDTRIKESIFNFDNETHIYEMIDNMLYSNDKIKQYIKESLPELIREHLLVKKPMALNKEKMVRRGNAIYNKKIDAPLENGEVELTPGTDMHSMIDDLIDKCNQDDETTPSQDEDISSTSLSTRLVNPKEFAKRFDTDQPKNNSNTRVLQAYLGLTQSKLLHVADNHLISRLNSLRYECPNFADVVTHIENYAHMSMITNTPFYVPPMLLVGDPGIGKTFFMLKLAEYTQLDSKIFNLAGSSDILKFTGSSPHYSSSAPSLLTLFASNAKFANAIVVLDELDKASNMESNQSVQNVLLALTERTSSKTFEDAYISSPTIDMSNLIYIATANDISTIDKTLLTRFQVFKVCPISIEQKIDIIRQIFRSVHDEFRAEAFINRVLTEDVCTYLANINISMREMKRVLMNSLCSAIRRVNNNPDDIANFIIDDVLIDNKEDKVKFKMGFN